MHVKTTAVKWTCHWVWTHWAIGVGWTRVADMPGFDGGQVWWENDTTLVMLWIGPLTVKCFVAGPRRNVRVELTPEMIERN
jgi:hypothetical protein